MHGHRGICRRISMATASASSVQSHYSLLTSVPTRSSSHLLLSFSQCLAYSQFHRTSTALASWPLKQSSDAPKPTKIKTKSPPLKKEKPQPTPKRKPDVSKLFHRSCNVDEVPGITATLYSGGQTWLPPAPEVSRPRAIYNAASLAYLGDCIYENLTKSTRWIQISLGWNPGLGHSILLGKDRIVAMQLYARRHFLFPPLSINEYNHCVMALVCCEAQDTFLKELLKDDFLSEEERDVIRWGRNIQSGKTRTTRRAGAAVYSRASSLETLVQIWLRGVLTTQRHPHNTQRPPKGLVGYLYLTDANRLDTIMRKLGFCTDHIVPTSLEGLN